jgi:YVTN family beta-propeller protein
VAGETLETYTTLPFAAAANMVVDTETGYVFVSGGSSSTYIEVLNLSGQIVGQIQNENGATGLALSSDGGTLYAADSASDSIAVINASTLTQTASYPTVVAPTYLALSGGNLWFTTFADMDIHELALSTGTASTTSVGTTAYSSTLAASPSAPSVLVSGTPGLDPATIDVFTVASGAPVYTAGGWLGSVTGDSEGCANLGVGGMAITPDGKSLDLACGAPYYGLQLSLAGMNSVEQTYNTGAYPKSVAISADGETLIGSSGVDESAYVFAPSNSTAVEAVGATGPDEPVFAGWGANDSVFFEIAQGYSAHATFDTFRTGLDLGLTMSAPQAVFPGSTYTVSGRLTSGGSALSGVEVSVADGSWVSPQTFTTDSNGGFSFTASARATGTSVTYTATVAGTTPTLTASSTITTIPVKYPVSTRPVRTPVKAVRATSHR